MSIFKFVKHKYKAIFHLSIGKQMLFSYNFIVIQICFSFSFSFSKGRWSISMKLSWLTVSRRRWSGAMKLSLTRNCSAAKAAAGEMTKESRFRRGLSKNLLYFCLFGSLEILSAVLLVNFDLQWL